MHDRRRVALYGGSFDPVHAAHIETAKRAERVFDLDQVVWMPAAQPPHKPGRELAPGALRLAMLYLATAEHGRWIVSEEELARGGTSYTYDTVLALPRVLGEPREALELFLLIGSDNLPGLPGWHRVAELLDEVQPIVAWREGDPDEHLEALRGRLAPRHVEKLRRGFLRLAPIELSSTDLRARLARGEDCAKLIPPLALEFIREHGLYGSPAADAPGSGASRG